MAPGWKALTARRYDLGLALPGASFAAEFINAKRGGQLYLPLVLRDN